MDINTEYISEKIDTIVSCGEKANKFFNKYLGFAMPVLTPVCALVFFIPLCLVSMFILTFMLPVMYFKTK